jgi:hypothetical protein
MHGQALPVCCAHPHVHAGVANIAKRPSFNDFLLGTKSAMARYRVGPMRTHTPKNPSCEACGRPTSLVRSEPHPKFANMLQRVFICRCGASTSDIVAATTRRPAFAAKITTAIQGA